MTWPDNVSAAGWMPQAVVLAAGSYPEREEALALLHNAPFLVCCDGAADGFLAHCPHPERIGAVVGDGDSISPQNRERLAGKFFREAEQETNDLCKAMRHLQGRGMTRVAVLGATGRREDHTLGNIALLAHFQRSGMDVRMVTDEGVFVPCRGRHTFRVEPGRQLSVFNLGASHLQATGLKYPLYDFTEWWQGTLNEATQPLVTIRAQGDFLVFVCFPSR